MGVLEPRVDFSGNDILAGRKRRGGKVTELLGERGAEQSKRLAPSI